MRSNCIASAALAGVALLSASNGRSNTQQTAEMPTAPKVATAPPATGSVDAEASTLLRQVEAATRDVQTLVADYTIVNTPLKGNQYRKPAQATTDTGTLQFKRPYLMRNLQTRQGVTGSRLTVCDGKGVWIYKSADKSGDHYLPREEPNGSNDLSEPDDYTAFAVGLISLAKPDFSEIIAENQGTIRYLGRRQLQGASYRVVEMEGAQNTIRWYVGDDNLLHAVQDDEAVGNAPQRIETVFTRLRVNVPVEDKAFAFTPPPGTKIADIAPLDSTMLAVGSALPQISYPSLEQGEQSDVHLPESCKNSKVTLLEVWSWYCGPCHVAVPKLQKLYADYKAKGLQLISIHEGLVSPSDPKEKKKFDASAQAADDYTRNALRGYSEKYQLTYPMLMDTSAKVSGQLKVPGVPSFYLLDADGKVLYRSAGYNDKRTRMQLAKQGIK